MSPCNAFIDKEIIFKNLVSKKKKKTFQRNIAYTTTNNICQETNSFDFDFPRTPAPPTTTQQVWERMNHEDIVDN